MADSLTSIVINPESSLEILGQPSESVQTFINNAWKIFMSYLDKTSQGESGENGQKLEVCNLNITSIKQILKSFNFKISIEVATEKLSLDLDTDESYKMILDGDAESSKIVIKSSNVFGARHALESLSQLITFDDQLRDFRIPSSFSIVDRPAFK